MTPDQLAPERLTEDTLFLACTRPAMIFGAPMEAVGINLIFSGIAFLAGGNLLYLLIAPVLHMLAQSICKHDCNAFRVLFSYFDTKARARNAGIWGGNSYPPLVLARTASVKGLRHG